MGQGTYVFQILHDIKEPFSLLILIPHPLDGLPGDEILGYLCPPLIGARALPGSFDLDLAVLVIDGDVHFAVLPLLEQAGSHHQGAAGGAATIAHPDFRVFVALRDELRAADATVARPRHLSGTAADTIQLDTLGSGRYVDNGPVPCVAVPCFTHPTARIDAAGDVVSLFAMGGGR